MFVVVVVVVGICGRIMIGRIIVVVVVNDRL